MGTDESPQQDGAAATPAASPSGSTTDIIQGKKQLARAMMEARRTLDDREIGGPARGRRVNRCVVGGERFRLVGGDVRRVE